MAPGSRSGPRIISAATSRIVGLAEAEGFLHDLRDIAEFVSDQPVTACDGVVDVDAPWAIHSPISAVCSPTVADD